MPDQKVMKIHLAKQDEVSLGDIVQCPRCCEKFVVLPNMILPIYWEPFGPYGKDDYFDPYDKVVCPYCGAGTKAEYHVAQFAAGVEIPQKTKPKEVKPDGQPGPRKGISKQRTRKPDGDQAHPKKTRSPRSKGA